MGQKSVNRPNDGEKNPEGVAVEEHTRCVIGIFKKPNTK